MFTRFIRYYRPHWKLFTLDMSAALFMAGIDLIYPAFTARFIDDFIPNNNVSAISSLLGFYSPCLYYDLFARTLSTIGGILWEQISNMICAAISSKNSNYFHLATMMKIKRERL